MLEDDMEVLRLPPRGLTASAPSDWGALQLYTFGAPAPFGHATGGCSGSASRDSKLFPVGWFTSSLHTLAGLRLRLPGMCSRLEADRAPFGRRREGGRAVQPARRPVDVLAQRALQHGCLPAQQAGHAAGEGLAQLHDP